MPSLAAQITPAGISAPDFDDVLAQLQNGAAGIYGSDIVTTPDTQDEQYLSIFAQAITDANQTLIATYNAFSPANAQGAGLSSIVKINGLKRETPSNSQIIVTVGGQVGTPIINGLIGDNLNLGTTWSLPPLVTIPNAGTINVTATCTQPGAITVPNNSLTNILNPTLGWQSVTNGANTASPGNPVEQDAALRQRQTVSTANPSQTILEGIQGALAALSGVGRLFVYENDTKIADGNGIPASSIAAVISGGDAIQIAQTIALKKAPGTGTFGTTSEIVIDTNGVPNTINFFPLTNVPLTLSITIAPLAGFVSTTSALIQASVAGFINGFAIGEDSFLNRLWAPANLSGDAATTATGLTQAQLDALSKTYNVTSILQSRAGPPAAADVAIAFNEAATATNAAITVIT
jgi:uncharacterized phage protein gp47/JayE